MFKIRTKKEKMFDLCIGAIITKNKEVDVGKLLADFKNKAQRTQDQTNVRTLASKFKGVGRKRKQS